MGRLTIGDVMSRHPQTVSADESAATALEIMRKNSYHHLPVVKDGKFFSLVSAREITLLLSMSPDPERLAKRKVGDFAAMDCFSVQVDTPLLEVLKIIVERRIGSVVIVEDDCVSGIFTITDSCRLLRDMILSEQG